MHGKHPELGQFFLRVGLGILFLAFGLMKLFLAKPSGVTEMLSSIGFPAPALFAWILILAEIVGGFLLIIGYQVKIATSLLGIVIVVAILTVQIPSLGGDGTMQFFKDLSILVGLIAIFFGGAGKWCIDKTHTA